MKSFILCAMGANFVVSACVYVSVYVCAHVDVSDDTKFLDQQNSHFNSDHMLRDIGVSGRDC